MTQSHKIKVYRAILKRDVRTLSKMVTYVAIQMGNIIKKTLIDDKGGKRPTWNQTLQLKAKQTKGKIAVYDRDNFNEQLVGQGFFDLKDISDVEESVIDISYQSQVIGKIFVKLISRPSLNTYPQISSLTPTKQAKQTQNTFHNVATHMFQNKNGQQDLQQQQTPKKQNNLNIFIPQLNHQQRLQNSPQPRYDVPLPIIPQFQPQYLNLPIPQLFYPTPTHVNSPHFGQLPIPIYHPPYVNSLSPQQYHNQYNNRNIFIPNQQNQRYAIQTNKKQIIAQQTDLLDQFIEKRNSSFFI